MAEFMQQFKDSLFNVFISSITKISFFKKTKVSSPQNSWTTFNPFLILPKIYSSSKSWHLENNSYKSMNSPFITWPKKFTTQLKAILKSQPPPLFVISKPKFHSKIIKFLSQQFKRLNNKSESTSELNIKWKSVSRNLRMSLTFSPIKIKTSNNKTNFSKSSFPSLKRSKLKF